jgi:hypothetical protein
MINIKKAQKLPICLKMEKFLKLQLMKFISEIY